MRPRPAAPEGWRDLFNPDYAYPDDLLEQDATRRQRRRARKGWRRQDRQARQQWLSDQRALRAGRSRDPMEPLAVLVVIGLLALVVGGASLLLPGLLGNDARPTTGLLSAPGNSTPGLAATTLPTTSAPPTLPTGSAPPAPVAASPDVVDVARRYLASRENAVAYTHVGPRDWLAEVQPLMTPAGWTQLSATLTDRGQLASDVAHQRQWSVIAAVSCQLDDEAGAASPASTTVLCAVTDQTVNASGTAVAVQDLPDGWPYNGPQTPAVLSMVGAAGQWLVDADQTGRAG